MNERVRVKGGGLYTKVVDRLSAFKEKYHPDEGFTIKTDITTLTDNYVVFKAEIISKDGVILSTGHGFNAIAKEKSLEKAETVAVGRALAFFDPMYGGESELASQEEMEKFQELTKDDGGQFPQTQKKPNSDLVEALENDKPILNGTVDQAMKKMTNGSNGEVNPSDFEQVEDSKIPFNGENKGRFISQIKQSTLEWYVDNMDLKRWEGLKECMVEWIEVKKKQNYA
tara:strand:- start:2570 stop:3250 length:681 start_codon:yes stop_codon:yes gene_type:complete